MEKYYLKDDDYDEGVPSITTYYKGNYPSVVDRYFTKFYHRKESETGENEDHIVLFHSNRLILVGLAKSHVAFSKGIESIDYNIGNSDRSLNHVSGKRKRGGMNLQPTTTLANIKCKDGSEYKVVSCITGKLIEVNSRLENNLENLSVVGTGYVAVVLCKPENCEKMKSTLITEDKYIE